LPNVLLVYAAVMVSVSLDDAVLRLTFGDLDQVLALNSTLCFRMDHIRDLTRDPAGIHDWRKGPRMGGDQLPGLIAGTFFYHSDSVFCDVNNPDKVTGITLFDERYKEPICQAGDPDGVVYMIRPAPESD
jgi:hypothetical protein